MGIELVTYKGQTVTPKDDALLQQYTLGQDGFFYGCAVTYTGGNTLHLSSGEGVICGREFKLDDTDLSAALPASGTLLGQVYAHIDLSNEDNPIQLIIETAAELTELTKDDDLNINNGEYDLQICTFTASPSALSDVESTVVYLVKGGGGGSMANAYDSSSPYVIGENFTKDGVYYEVIAPISAGDPLVIDTNVKVTNPGAQITAINQNLTKCLTYNETTDFYGAVNPNTHQWVDLLYAGFNVNDIFYKTWKNQAYNRTHNGGGSIDVNSNHIYVSSSTTYNTYDSMMLLTPINVTPSSVLNLRSQLYHSNGCVATIFITDQSNLSAFTFQSTGHCTNADLLILAEGVNDTQGVYTAHDIQAQNLSQLMSSKYTDLTKQYYIGVVCNCGYGGNHSNCEITELSVG